MNTDAELFALQYKEKTTCDIIVEVPGCFASICDVRSESFCLRLAIADPYSYQVGNQILVQSPVHYPLRQAITSPNCFLCSVYPLGSETITSVRLLSEIRHCVMN